MSHYYASSSALQKPRHKKCRGFFYVSPRLAPSPRVSPRVARSLAPCVVAPCQCLAPSRPVWHVLNVSPRLNASPRVPLYCVLSVSLLRRLSVCQWCIASLYGQNRGQWWLVEKPVDTTQSGGVIHNRTDVRLSVFHNFIHTTCGQPTFIHKSLWIYPPLSTALWITCGKRAGSSLPIYSEIP